ncbi:caspase family protein [Glycomyces sp. NPDC021274]|uniref:caspase family protein n=1 Tax=Glycomyces sp. NPDC021274 TaxID=3155120 RepID=UPI0033EC9709
MPEHRYRALLIGNAVFRRDPQGLPKLHGPRADVDALCDALADPESGLFAVEEIETLIDRSLQSLREELYRFFVTDATPDDVLFLYYSGHGKLDIQGRLHLCTNDTRMDSLRVTALQYKEHIEELIKESPANAAVTILDCCHSGAFRGGELKVKATGKGRCVITSASANELALDAFGPGGTSPFTSALVTGLRFARADGRLTTQDLYDYVETELSPAGNSRPQFYFDGEGSIALANRSPRKTPSAPSQVDIAPVTTDTVAAQSAPIPDQRTPELGRSRSGPIVPALPEPRTHLWTLLNEAATSALSEKDRGQASRALQEVAEEAARFDVRWPIAVLKRLGNGPERQAVAEALLTGLAKLNPIQAIEFARDFYLGSPERTGAHLAIASVLPESEQELAQRVLWDAFDSCALQSGKRVARLIVRILEIRSYLDVAEPPESVAALVRVAKGLNSADREIWAEFDLALKSCLSQERDPVVRAQSQADAALKLALFDPVAAQDFFRSGDHFLPEPAFKLLPIADITMGGAAMLGVDPATGHRLFEVAERRCRSQDDWIEFFDALIGLVGASPGPTPTTADHLVTMMERAADRVSDNEWWQVSSAAEALVASAPVAAGRLLRLDPDEDRMRRNLIRLAKEAAAVDASAARHIATAAERLVLSIIDESEQAQELGTLAEAFAAVDPEHAVRLLKSIPGTDGRRPAAIAKVAAVVTAAFPDRISMLADVFNDGDGLGTPVAAVYEGVAKIDPDRAMQLIAPFPDSPFKNLVIESAAASLAETEPDRAAELAFDIEDQARRGHALLTIVQKIVASEPERAGALARRIPDNDDCGYARITALCAAGRALVGQNPYQAEQLLRLAETTANSMKDDCRKGAMLSKIATVYIEIGSATLQISKLLARAEACASANPDDDPDDRTSLLAEVMIGLALIAPKRAERIAETLPDQWSARDADLGNAAKAMAPNDPRRAQQFASMISENWELLRTQAALVEEFCRSAPARAEHLALSMAPGEYRTRALLAVAEAGVRRQSW